MYKVKYTRDASRISKGWGLGGSIIFEKSNRTHIPTTFVTYELFQVDFPSHECGEHLAVGNCKNCGHLQYFAEKPKGGALDALRHRIVLLHMICTNFAPLAYFLKFVGLRYHRTLIFSNQKKSVT